MSSTVPLFAPHIQPPRVDSSIEPHGHPGVPDEKPHATTATGAQRSEIYHKGARHEIRYDLMLRNTAGMRRLAEVYGEGVKKYGPDNWMNGFSESVLIQHAMDHIISYLNEGNKVEDNLGHAVWNLLTLMWVEENKPELLDITKPEQEP